MTPTEKRKRHADWARTKYAANAAHRKKEVERSNLGRLDPEMRVKNAERARIYRAGGVKEITIEDYLLECVEARGGFCPKFTSPGMKGAPDRIVCLAGHPAYFVELKRPRGGKTADVQTRYHKKLRAAGQRVWVLWTLASVDAFFAEVGA
jgi:hypothetical protein